MIVSRRLLVSVDLIVKVATSVGVEIVSCRIRGVVTIIFVLELENVGRHRHGDGIDWKWHRTERRVV